MDIELYQTLARRSALEVDADAVRANATLIYHTIGLAGETGEFADKVKKMIRDSHGVIDDATKQSMVKELGDILWYMSAVCDALGMSMDDVARVNLAKTDSRVTRGVINGTGDDR